MQGEMVCCGTLNMLPFFFPKDRLLETAASIGRWTSSMWLLNRELECMGSLDGGQSKIT